MLSWLKREPLVHFLLVGGLLYVLFGQEVVEPVDAVRISTADLEAMVGGFSDAHRRPPTEWEIDDLVERRVRALICQREARERGLLGDGAIDPAAAEAVLAAAAVRDATAPEPDDDTLATMLAADPQRYARVATWSFHQIFFDPLRRGDEAAGDAQLTSAALQAMGDADSASGRGDPFPGGSAWRRCSPEQVATAFGASVADHLAALPIGRWSDPVAGSHGWHLLYVVDWQAATEPRLDDLRDRLRADALAAWRTAVWERAYRALRQGYQVVIE